MAFADQDTARIAGQADADRPANFAEHLEPDGDKVELDTAAGSVVVARRSADNQADIGFVEDILE